MAAPALSGCLECCCRTHSRTSTACCDAVHRSSVAAGVADAHTCMVRGQPGPRADIACMGLSNKRGSKATGRTRSRGRRCLQDQTLAPAAAGGFTVNPACFYMIAQDLLASMRHSGVDIMAHMPSSTLLSQSGLLSGVPLTPSDRGGSPLGPAGSLAGDQQQPVAEGKLRRQMSTSGVDKTQPGAVLSCCNCTKTVLSCSKRGLISQKTGRLGDGV